MSSYAPLLGSRVVELGHMVSAPYAGLILAELGADVVKVEPLTGDGARHLGPPFVGDDAALFMGLNSGKRSVAIDLHLPEGQTILRELLKRSDALITNFRRGALERLGVGHDAIRSEHPNLLYVLVSAFGIDEPKDIAAVDINIEGLSGLMMATGWPGSPPLRSALPFADIGAAFFAALSVSAQLAPQQTPSEVGSFIDLSMLDSMMYLCQPLYSYATAEGEDPRRLGNRSEYGLVDCLPAADGWITVAAPSDRLFARLCTAIEHADLLDRYPTPATRRSGMDELIDALSEIFATQDTAYWVERLSAAGVPAAPVNSPREALLDPRAQRRRTIIEERHPVLGHVGRVRFPVGGPTNPSVPALGAAPLLGHHTWEVLQEVGGFSKDSLESLANLKVISAAPGGP